MFTAKPTAQSLSDLLETERLISRQIQAEQDLEEQAELRRQHIVILDRAIEVARMVRDDPEAAEMFRGMIR